MCIRFIVLSIGLLLAHRVLSQPLAISRLSMYINGQARDFTSATALGQAVDLSAPGIVNAELGEGSNAVRLAVPVYLYANAGAPPVQSIQVGTMYVQSTPAPFHPTRVTYRASLQLPASLPGGFHQGPVVFGLGTPTAPQTVFPQRFMIRY